MDREEAETEASYIDYDPTAKQAQGNAIMGKQETMKILRQVCGYCGNVQLYSVEVVCRPGTHDDIGPKQCLFCGTQLGVVLTATELDMEEVSEQEPDAAAMLESIQKFPESQPERA